MKILPIQSHLLQMRGLKHISLCHKIIVILSHLLQMRGLKPVTNKTIGIDKLSHLLQMRGLKRFQVDEALTVGVASFTDAWIETLEEADGLEKEKVASFTDAWIETLKICL